MEKLSPLGYEFQQFKLSTETGELFKVLFLEVPHKPYFR
jgi:hypothetical protein